MIYSVLYLLTFVGIYYLWKAVKYPGFGIAARVAVPLAAASEEAVGSLLVPEAVSLAWPSIRRRPVK
ncbi:MAG: hypothetical protein PHO26_06555 [Dehalococcoidia bacterium]|nr:hypothetical protein [Dehalococcoidia bacterium]MDD5493409.1 hypothetical protein [Dehalococcoidia bacterium]